MAEKISAGAVLEKKLPAKNPSSLSIDIKSVLDTLDAVSLNLELAKNGDAGFGALVDENGQTIRETRSRVLLKVPHVLWINTDSQDSLGEVQPEYGRLTEDRKQNIKRGYKNPDGLISIPRISDTLGIPNQKIHSALRNLNIQTIIAGSGYRQHVTAGEFMEIRKYLLGEKSREGDVVFQQVPVPDGALPVWKVCQDLDINPGKYSKLARELGIEKIKIGGKYYLGREDQGLLRELKQTMNENNNPPDGAIRVSAVLENLGIYSKFFSEIARKLEINKQRFGMGFYVLSEDVKKIEEHIENIKKVNPDSEFFIKSMPEGALSPGEFCEMLGGDKQWLSMAKRELGINYIRVGSGYLLTYEDQERIRERIDLIKNQKKTEMLNLYDIPDGAKKAWEFCREVGIGGGALIRIVNKHGVDVLKANGRSYLTAESQDRIIEIIQQEKNLKGFFGKIIKGGGYSLEEHERLSAVERLSSYAREDGTRRAKRVSQFMPKRSGAVKPKETVLTEAPDGYITLRQMWAELGISGGSSLNLRRTLDLPFIKIGLRKYFDGGKVKELKEIIALEGDKPEIKLQKKLKTKTTFTVSGLGEGWIPSGEVVQMLGLSASSLGKIVADRKDMLTINKIGSRNYFRREEILKIRDSRAEKNLSNASKSSRFEVKDIEDKDGYGEEDGESIKIYFSEVRGNIYSSAKNRAYGRKVFKGEIALLQLEKILESETIPKESSDRIGNLLKLPKAKFLLTNLKGTIKGAVDGKLNKNGGLFKTAESAQRQGRWILKKIGNGHDDLEKIMENRIRIALEGFGAHDSLVSDNLRLAAGIAYRYRGRGLPAADLIGYANEGLMQAAAKYNFKQGYEFSTYATHWIKQKVQRATVDYGRSIRLPVFAHEQFVRIGKIEEELEQELGRKPSMGEVAKKAGIKVGDYRTILNATYVDSLNRLVGGGGDDNKMELGEVIAVDSNLDTHALAVKMILKEKFVEILKTYLTVKEREVLELRFGLGEDGSAKTLEQVGFLFEVTRERIRQIEAMALKKLRCSGVLRQLRDFL